MLFQEKGVDMTLHCNQGQPYGDKAHEVELLAGCELKEYALGTNL